LHPVQIHRRKSPQKRVLQERQNEGIYEYRSKALLKSWPGPKELDVRKITNLGARLTLLIVFGNED